MLSMSNASSFLGTKLPNAYITQALIQQGTTIINPTMDIHYGDGVIIKQENLNGTTELVQATNNS